MSDEELAIIIRLSNRKTLLEMFPHGTQKDPHGTHNWCRARHSSDPDSTYKYCTRQVGHDGPHVDYRLSKWTLIWDEGKVFQIDEGDGE